MLTISLDVLVPLISHLLLFSNFLWNDSLTLAVPRGEGPSPLKTTKHCHYFNTDKSCSFEELGCKFLHLFSDTEVKRSSWKQVISTLEESWESFYTSTPRKPFDDCTECMEISKCTDCIVKHTLGRHACAKLMFS